MLPDLDSDSGVPVRELFSLLAVVVPILLIDRLRLAGFDGPKLLVLLAGIYVLIRYGISRIFNRITVHRGMFHSIPAMFVCGMSAYLLFHHKEITHRLFVAAAVMLGFLSHLVLDELYSVDFMGARIRLNKYAGSAVKLYSSSLTATAICYAVLGALVWRAWAELQ
jgi:hypothetical protein